MNELTLEARTENLDRVLAFVREPLEAFDCSPKALIQLEIAVEELFVNIASYAYAPDTGAATVRVEVTQEPLSASVTLIDSGVPYDPLAKEDPDVTLAADERKIGGLGIYMVKKSMDDISYERKDGQNVIRIQKRL